MEMNFTNISNFNQPRKVEKVFSTLNLYLSDAEVKVLVVCLAESGLDFVNYND